MQVATVTTSDNSLLRAVRHALTGVDEAFLCVAFVHERGLCLLEKELESLKARRARTRLLVTTTFQQQTTQAALARAHNLGLDVRVLNPGSGSTFHPKLYLGHTGAHGRAVVGSANLTGGLATNIEAAVALEGERSETALTHAWDWAESLWADRRAEPWQASGVAEEREETFTPTLYALLEAAVRHQPVFQTLGRTPKDNRVTELTPVEVHVATERSLKERSGAAPIPAWMFNLAWERLRTHGTLTNTELLNDLRVHRSSAVCALLARLPPVEVVPGRTITLRWGSSAGA